MMSIYDVLFYSSKIGNLKYIDLKNTPMIPRRRFLYLLHEYNQNYKIQFKYTIIIIVYFLFVFSVLYLEKTQTCEGLPLQGFTTGFLDCMEGPRSKHCPLTPCLIVPYLKCNKILHNMPKRAVSRYFYQKLPKYVHHK